MSPSRNLSNGSAKARPAALGLAALAAVITLIVVTASTGYFTVSSAGSSAILAAPSASSSAAFSAAASPALFSSATPDAPVITGTFLDFQHHNTAEAPYWNPQAAAFTDAMWEAKVEEMADLGIHYIVVMAVALNGYSFYPSEIYPKYPLRAEDPVKAILTAAERRGVKVFLGAGFYGDWRDPYRAFRDSGIRERTRRAIKELAEKYGRFTSFYGFYWPNEVGISGHFPQAFIDHVKENNAWAKQYLPRAKTLIAPYGTNMAVPDETYVRQLKEMGVNIVAYQDEVGVRKTSPYDLKEIFAGLRQAHDKAGVTMWADMEIFDFEGAVYKSALIPASMERIKVQLNAIAPCVEEIICYQYLGLMDRPKSAAPAGPLAAQQLYNDYVSYLANISISPSHKTVSPTKRTGR